MIFPMDLDFEKEVPKPGTLEECHLVIEALWDVNWHVKNSFVIGSRTLKMRKYKLFLEKND